MNRLALLLLAWLGSAVSLAQPIGVSPRCDKQSFCEWRQFSPSGPRVTRQWRQADDAIPYKIEIDGAAAGRVLFGGMYLQRDAQGDWQAIGPNGNSTLLLKSTELVPKAVDGLNEMGYRWRMTVTAKHIPVTRPGIATEDEPRLNVRLTRTCN